MVYSTGYFYEKGREVTYISKKINKKTVEIPTVKKLNKGEYAVAYTKFKKYTGEIHPENESILWVDYGAYKVFEKRKKLHKINGYIPVGDNEFIAIQKRRFLPLIILPMILLILLSLIYFGDNTSSVINDWIPNIDENLNVYKEKEKSSSAGDIKFSTFSKWYVPTGETEDVAIRLQNHEDNRCFFTIIITLDETGEVLCQTEQIPPGNSIYIVDLSRPLQPGEYKATMHFITNMVSDGSLLNDFKNKIEIVCY